jgi:hypothetical protein
VGTDTEYARQDHEHQVVTTGTPGDATPGDTAAAGSSDNLSRLDHQHGLPAFGDGSTQFCVGDDARLTDDRTADEISTSGTNVTISQTAPTGADEILVTTSATAAGWETGTDVTALLDEFAKDSGAQGVVPASDNNTSKFLRADGTWDIPPGAGGISTGTGDPTGGSDGDFYYDTVSQQLWYNDTATWEVVGVVVDDVTIEVDETNGLQLIDAGTVATTKLSATGTKNSTTFLRGDDTWDVPIDTPRPALSKSVTIPDPVTAEDVTLFYTPVAITITQIAAVIRGTTPSVLWFIKHATMTTGRDSAGAAVITAGTTTTDEGGVSITSFDDATIPADSFLWVETTTVSGTNDELALTVVYTED